MQVDKHKQGNEPEKGHAWLLGHREVLAKQKWRQRPEPRVLAIGGKEVLKEKLSVSQLKLPGVDKTLIISEVSGSR